MNFTRRVFLFAAVCLIAALTCCGKADKTKETDTGSTAEQADTETANTDLSLDSEKEETGEEERKASMDLFWEEGDICTQYIKLTSLGDCKEELTCHYFQDPEEGRYVLDLVENSSMEATEGAGGLVFSVVLAEKCPEEPPGEGYDYLGTLEQEGGKLFHVLIEYPEGAQYTETGEESYNRIMDAARDAAGSLEGRNGYKFKAGEYPGNAEE
jgi:hypothetical protein